MKGDASASAFVPFQLGNGKRIRTGRGGRKRREGAVSAAEKKAENPQNK